MKQFFLVLGSILVRRLVLLGAVLFGAWSGAFTQSTEVARQYPVAQPELPALTLLEANAARITRPGAPRALLTELVNGLDSAGRVKQGLAVAVAPYSLLRQQVRLADYQRNYGQYLASNAQLSLGTVRGAGSTGATDLSVGARLTLFDGSDPMRSAAFTDSVRAMLLQALPTYSPQDLADAPARLARLAQQARRAQAVADSLQGIARSSPGPGAANVAKQAAAAAGRRLTTAQSELALLNLQATRYAAASQAVAARLARHRQQWNRTHWNAPSLAVAGASGWRLNDSRLTPDASTRQLGWSAWATGGLPLGGAAGQLLGQVRYTYARQPLDLAGPLQADEQVLYGARAVFGSAAFNFYAELSSTTHSTPLPGQPASHTDWGGGLEFRTTEGMWLSTGFGRQIGRAGSASAGGLLFGGLRWQLADAARFKPTH